MSRCGNCGSECFAVDICERCEMELREIEEGGASVVEPPSGVLENDAANGRATRSESDMATESARGEGERAQSRLEDGPVSPPDLNTSDAKPQQGLHPGAADRQRAREWLRRNGKHVRTKTSFADPFGDDVSYLVSDTGDVASLAAEFSRVRREALEEAARVAEGGRFLHDDAPDARFGKAVASAIRALASPSGTTETK